MLARIPKHFYDFQPVIEKIPIRLLSWVRFIVRSRGSTLRSACRPLGRSDSKKVHEGNVMTARVMVLMILAACKGCWSILEQPQSSLMSCHPTFQRMLKLLRIFKVTVKMCDYGGSTDKPLTLFSSHFA